MRRMAEADIRREVKRVLELIQLPDVEGRLPRALSGGQQQRIALARCIVYRPSIILMDEPLGALDKKLRDQMKLEIKHLHESLGITVLYVTHDQEEAMVMSDRICLMNDAKIEQLGSPSDLYFRPDTVFAADFLGESNFLDATVEKSVGADMLVRMAGGTALKAGRSGRDVAKGDAVKLMVRPEMLRVLESEAKADNVVEGVLDDVILVGGVTKFYLRLEDGTAIIATDLTRGPRGGLARNEKIRVGWDTDSAVLLPTEKGAA
jgi:putative spermidine/putrescine transport system ATP-binding protein